MNKSNIYEVAGIKIALTDNDGPMFSQFISEMSDLTSLKSIIETDSDGLIVNFTPNGLSWGFIFFIQNLMIMQRLKLIDDFMKENRKK